MAVCTGSSFFMAVYYSIVYVLIPYFCPCYWSNGLPKWLSSKKKAACSAGDEGSTPGLGVSPGEGNGNPL